MTDVSSLYHKWLGIPPKDQPPNHYRLLGIELFESDPDVIDIAADQRMTHIRRFQTGAESAFSQRILNEISTARLCLLDPAKKDAYDAQLRSSITPPHTHAPAPPPSPVTDAVEPAIPPGGPVVTAPRDSGVTKRRSQRQPTTSIAGIVAGSVGGLVLGYIVLCLVSPQSDFLDIFPNREIAEAPPRQPPEPASAPVAPVLPPPPPEPRTGDTTTKQEQPAPEPEVDTALPSPDSEPGSEAVQDPAGETNTGDSSTDGEQPGGDPPTKTEQQDMSASPAEAPPRKAPVPGAEAAAQAAEKVREVFKADLKQASTEEEKRALANRMIEVGVDTDDLTTRYALFQKALKLARSIADVPTALLAAEALDAVFQGDVLRLKASVLHEASEQIHLPEDHELLGEFFAAVVEEAVSQGRFEVAQPLADIALKSARKSRNTDHIKDTVRRLNRVQELAEAFATVKEAIETLETEPTDAEANLAAGEYYCFVLADWEKGLPLLALGSDDRLSRLARQETDPDSISLNLGDDWWEIAEQLEGQAATNVKVHAAQWYQKDLPSLSGVAKSRTEKRVQELRRATPEARAKIPPPLAVAPFDAQNAAQHQEAWATHLGTAVEVTNSIGMKLKLIPPGEFLMGSPVGEANRDSGEGPQHRVRLTKPHYLGVYEVTQGEYERVMGTNPSSFSRRGRHSGRVSGQDTSRFPVEHVLWEDAMEFCRKLSALPSEQSLGRVYRLPTEAEWEYACRAGTTTPFHFGPQLNEGDANYSRNLGRPRTVGSYASNAFGLYDMHGNVFEWCSDWYGSGYYGVSAVEDPTGPATGSLRVRRGGCWSFPAGRARSASRSGFVPSSRDSGLGFRLALSPSGE